MCGGTRSRLGVDSESTRNRLGIDSESIRNRGDSESGDSQGVWARFKPRRLMGPAMDRCWRRRACSRGCGAGGRRGSCRTAVIVASAENVRARRKPSLIELAMKRACWRGRGKACARIWADAWRRGRLKRGWRSKLAPRARAPRDIDGGGVPFWLSRGAQVRAADLEHRRRGYKPSSKVLRYV